MKWLTLHIHNCVRVSLIKRLLFFFFVQIDSFKERTLTSGSPGSLTKFWSIANR